jgi:hemoglobin
VGRSNTDYDRIGGEEGLERLVRAFVDRFFADFIIGFMFEDKDRERIVRHEVELASAHLGGPHRYGGRNLGEVHQPLRINKGHFRRRLAIVAHVLREKGVPDDIVERWIAHDQRLESVITTPEDCGT